jgi:hypothetical protein
MKPFDLEKALAGEPVVTRDGQAVTQLTKFDCDSEYPLCAVIDGVLITYTINGSYYTINGSYKEGEQHDLDLFMAEPERWANVYWDEEKNYGFISSVIYSSEAEARANIHDFQHYQTTIKLK